MFLEFCKIMCIILLSITLIFLIPFLINLSFKYSSIDLFSAEWSAGDLLSFYGTMLSFIGTTFLGCLTLYQNHTIKKNSDDRMKDLEKAEHDRNMPKFYITFSSCSGNKKHLSINLINISENIATNISISKIQDKNVDGTLINQQTRAIKIPVLKGGETQRIELNNYGLNEKEGIISFDLDYEDKYFETHHCVVDYIVDSEKISDLRFKISEKDE